MSDTNHIQHILSRLLTLGMLLSLLLVMMGGALYLWQHGHETMHAEWIAMNSYEISIKQIWVKARDLQAFGIIDLGIFILVMTQVLRVALLAAYYVIKRDYWFMIISLFILFVLLYSLFFRA